MCEHYKTYKEDADTAILYSLKNWIDYDYRRLLFF